jgi:TetR/AcrR family transcriptional regulator
MRQKKVRDPQSTRAAILAAAEAAFAARGLGGARVDDIAQRAGANKRMIYHYFGSKEGLYVEVLDRTYGNLRGSERELHLDHLDPLTAMRRLVEFNFDYTLAHPELISIINTENLHRARHLAKSRRVRELHSPLVQMIRRILQRGEAAGLFRGGVDPVQLYITIAGIGFFYLANRWTLSILFGRDLGARAMLRRRRAHNVETVLRSLRPDAPPLLRPARTRRGNGIDPVGIDTGRAVK